MRSCGSTLRRRAPLVVLLLAVLATSFSAQTSDPAVLYKETLAREAILRKELDAYRPPEPSAPLLARIRVVAGAFEDLARLFPSSGYSDNALWQGGLLAADAYWTFHQEEDRRLALRLLNGLVSRFPTSTRVKQVPPHVARLQQAAGRAGAPAPAATTTSAMLKEIRREVLPDALRITLDLEREVPFREERLEGPPRVFVDLQNTRAVEALKDATMPFPDDVVKQVRVGRQLNTRTRVVFDLNVAVPYSVYALYNPYRVVIDFERREPAAPASTNTAGGFSLSRQLGLGVARIAIDPGHGGHDPGAKVKGLTEADLVLDVALRLEKLLKKEKNVEVVLTRRGNTFVPLEERTAIANKSGADLFLSIHANASSVPTARGVETYFLNFAPNPEAEAIAARENAGSSRSMRHLPDLVQAIALNNKLDESRDFAAMVQSTLYQRLRRVNRHVRNLGVKQAPFMVLVGASMPSVLAEIAFMTNTQEAALLKTEKYRQQIADALFAGVMRYQESLKKIPAIAATR
jgi:N-acetylmuramoyl-L-alanine amidase